MSSGCARGALALTPPPENVGIARRPNGSASLLEGQGASPHRTRADRRAAAIRGSLGHRLARLRTPLRLPSRDEPSAGELLEVDQEYRDKAARGELRTIAPRRFNPTGEAWLPVLHTRRGPRHYTALFSNTQRAHEMGTTRDWVILYYDGDAGEHQCTVITAEWGPMRGRRIVRGREAECVEFYRRGDLWAIGL